MFQSARPARECSPASSQQGDAWRTRKFRNPPEVQTSASSGDAHLSARSDAMPAACCLLARASLNRATPDRRSHRFEGSRALPRVRQALRRRRGGPQAFQRSRLSEALYLSWCSALQGPLHDLAPWQIPQGPLEQTPTHDAIGSCLRREEMGPMPSFGQPAALPLHLWPTVMEIPTSYPWPTLLRHRLRSSHSQTRFSTGRYTARSLLNGPSRLLLPAPPATLKRTLRAALQKSYRADRPDSAPGCPLTAFRPTFLTLRVTE